MKLHPAGEFNFQSPPVIVPTVKIQLLLYSVKWGGNTQQLSSLFSVVHLETPTSILFMCCDAKYSAQHSGQSRIFVDMCVWAALFRPCWWEKMTWNRICHKLRPLSSPILLSLNLKCVFISHEHKQVVIQTVLRQIHYWRTKEDFCLIF